MSVGRDYLLAKPGRTSAAKLFIDTRLIPLGVNAAGWLEVALDRAAVRTGMRPALILAIGAGVSSVLLARLARRPRASRR